MTESHESEISREMIEAGLLHLYRYHPDTGVDDEETVRRIFLAMLDAAQSEPETTPLNEMGESIRKHGLPEIDRSPQPFWKNETTSFNLGDGTTVMVDPAENLRGKDG